MLVNNFRFSHVMFEIAFTRNLKQLEIIYIALENRHLNLNLTNTLTASKLDDQLTLLCWHSTFLANVQFSVKWKIYVKLHSDCQKMCCLSEVLVLALIFFPVFALNRPSSIRHSHKVIYRNETIPVLLSEHKNVKGHFRRQYKDKTNELCIEPMSISFCLHIRQRQSRKNKQFLLISVSQKRQFYV